MVGSEVPESPDMMVRYLRTGEVFTPSAPIDNQALFAGRVNQLNRIISAVTQRGQHAILFGERGVGKTSLANVLVKMMRGHHEVPIKSVIVNCNSEDSFEDLWLKIFRELEDNYNLDFEDKYETITPEFIRSRLQRSDDSLAIIITDEMDRISSESRSVALMADTIKTLSDHSVKAGSPGSMVVAQGGSTVNTAQRQDPSTLSISAPPCSQESLKGDTCPCRSRQLS